MKITHRIPTEQYGFVELEVEYNGISPEQIAQENRMYAKAFNVGAGLETKEWNKVLDRYLRGEGMDANVLEKLDNEQRYLIHELDKSANRMKGREDKPVIDGKPLKG